MTIIEQIKAEIEKRILREREVKDRYDSNTSSFVEGSIDALDGLLSFLSTLESEKPAPEDLEEAAEEWAENEAYGKSNAEFEMAYKGFIAGAKCQKEQFEKNRLANCDTLTKEEYDRETDFATEIIENEHRQPTFSDAINYGMRLQKEQDNYDTIFHKGMMYYRKQMMEEAVEAKVIESFNPATTIGEPTIHGCTIIYEDENKPYLVAGDKVRIIIVKED